MWTACASVAGNVLSSVGLIVVVKILVSDPFHFRAVTLLTGLHMFAVAVACKLMTYRTKDPAHEIPAIHVFGLFVLGFASIVGMNANLLINTVGFYQLSKLTCTPLTVASEFLVFGKEIGVAESIAVILVMVGVGGVVGVSTETTWIGGTAALVAAASTTWYQILIGRVQCWFKADQNTILGSTSSSMGLLCLLMSISIHEPRRTMHDTEMSTTLFNLVAASCILAVAVNMSTYSLIRHTSPLTYLMVGHAKTIMVITFGIIYFDESTHVSRIGFIALAIAGIVLFGRARARRSRATRSEDVKYVMLHPIGSGAVTTVVESP